ncbi:MAG: hypothetical protein ACO1OA_02440, partial [Paracoccus marcusii]
MRGVRLSCTGLDLGGGAGPVVGLLPPEAQGLIVAGALLSITLNPFVFRTVEPIERWVRARRGL